MNNKGFTLIELLATIIVLSIITTIAVPAINKIVQSNKQTSYDIQINSLKDSLKSYASDHVFSIPNNRTIYLTLYQLSNEGYCDMSIRNPLVGGNFPLDMTLKIKHTPTGFEYEVDDNSGVLDYDDSQIDNAGSLKLTTDFIDLKASEITDMKSYIKEAVSAGTDYKDLVTTTKDSSYITYKLTDTNGVTVSVYLNTATE